MGLSIRTAITDFDGFPKGIDGFSKHGLPEITYQDHITIFGAA